MQEFVGRLQPALEIFAAYPYLMLFIGLLLVGEMVLLPALYLAATGRLDALLVIAVAIFAGMLSDFLWYLLGRWYPARAVKKISRRLPAERLDRFEQLFARNGAALLFVSKFVYGTRIVAQVLAGSLRMQPGSWLWVNLLAVVTVTVLLAGLAWSVVGTVRHFEDLVEHIELAFLMFAIVAVAIYLIVGLLLKKRWFQSS